MQYTLISWFHLNERLRILNKNSLQSWCIHRQTSRSISKLQFLKKGNCLGQNECIVQFTHKNRELGNPLGRTTYHPNL